MKLETRIKRWIKTDMDSCVKWINFSHDSSSTKQIDLEVAFVHYKAVEKDIQQLNNFMLRDMGDF